MVAADKALRENTFVPPFPSLKRMYMVGNPKQGPAVWASDLAPSLDYFELDSCFNSDVLEPDAAFISTLIIHLNV